MSELRRFPLRSHLCSARPSTSDFRGAGLHVTLGTPGEGGRLASRSGSTPSRKWSSRFLRSKCPFPLALRSACGLSWKMLLCCLGRASAPFRPFLPEPASFSEAAGSWVFTPSGKRPWAEGSLLPQREARDARPPASHLWPHRMPLRSSPASSVPRRVTSSHTVPGQGQGPAVSLRTCISNSFLNCFTGRDVTKTASPS